MDDLVKCFTSPPAFYRGKPFWSWNGRLEKEELLRQVHVMKAMGFGGFFMHSRVGLATEYLGDEWFSLINTIADEAQRQGLEAWLYDEDRWPSGSAGGLVTHDVRYRMQYLRMTETPPDQFRWRDGILAAFACRLSGVDFTDCRWLAPGAKVEVAAGETVLAFTVEPMWPSNFYNGAAYLDTMNPEATKEFIRVTHEAYRARCGDRLGRSIRGIFTDEPHRGMVMSSFSGQPDPTRLVPWTTRFAGTFRERFGTDIVERLPEIFLRRGGERLSPVKWQYMEHLQQLFLDNFLRPVNEWCKAHNLVLTGHVLHEDSLVCQAVPNGSMMRNYEFMGLPGIDILTEGNRCYWAAKQVSSVARQLGRRQVLSELYGCTGWQFNFEGHKAVGDWQALFGVNLRCPHLSWYTMQGEAKRDYPASILHQSAWHREYRRVEDYFSRLHVVMEQGRPLCDLLVVNSVESVWAQIHRGWVSGLEAACPHIKVLEATYRNVFHALAGRQIDFDYGDEDHLRRLAHVEKAADGPVLVLGQARYRAVLVAGLETIRATTLSLLEEFARQGGKVIFAGPPPTHVDAQASPRAADLARSATASPLDAEVLAAACEKAAGPQPVSIVDGETGRTLTDVFCQARAADGAVFVVAINTNREAWRRRARVRICGRGAVEEWDCKTGERRSVASQERDGCVEVVTDFSPSGERIYRLVAARDPALPAAAALAEARRTEMAGPFAFSLDEPNVCVLDRARHRLDGGPWQPEAEILRVDRAVRKALGLQLRGGEMLQPWFAARQPQPPVRARLELEFEFHVGELPAVPVELVMEKPEAFQVSLNGKPLAASGARGWWVDICLKRIPLPPDALVAGRNTVSLAVGFNEGVDLEALYLLGGFGVLVEGTKRTLSRLPEKLAVGSVATQGLPFYGGTIVYHLPKPEKPSAGQKVFIETPGFEAACIIVGREGPMIAWQPYEADATGQAGGEMFDLQVILTRRNTFGPLHQAPLKADAYGPGNFTTEGAGWSENYMLYPAGLLKPPAVSWRQARV